MCRNFTVRLRRRGHTSIGNDLKTNFIAIGVVSVLLVLVPFFIFWTNSEWDAALYNAQAAADKSASLINIELETYLESSVRIVSSVFVRNGIKTDYQASTQQKVAFYNELENMLSNYTNSSADTKSATLE